MKKFLAALVLVGALGGCATEANFKTKADRTIGWTETALVSAMGPPQQAHVIDESMNQTAPSKNPDGTLADIVSGKVKFLAYSRTGADTMPGYWQCNRFGCFVQPPATFVYTCTLIFRVEGGKVVSYRYHGNSCVA